MDKRLFLIDGHALIFKMYYAFLRHPMINSKGADTSILFGFTKYILELIDKEKPTHLAISFDPPGGTFRHEMYPEYKGTRSETPQLIIDSLEPLIELCGAMRIPVLMVKGYEADDVIGTVAKKAEKEGFTVFMVTPDKDYGQLVTDMIFQYKPGKSGAENEICGTKEICLKYGISSTSQVIDMLTICGDASDNVPGVKGVGEVGAGKLISRYGSVEEIYAHIGDLTAKQREAFENARAHIGLSRELVTIRTDVPVEFNINDTVIDFEYDPQIADLFEKYEFGSLKKHISHISVPESSAISENILDIKDVPVQDAIEAARKAGAFSIFTECHEDSIFSSVKNVTVGVISPDRKYLASSGSAYDFAEILSDGSISKSGYDLKRQCNILKNNGLSLEGKLYDIELMHYLINPEKSHRIDILAKSYLNINIEDRQAEVLAAPMSLFDIQEDKGNTVSRTKEVIAAALLCEKINMELKELSLDGLYCTLEEPLIRVLSNMECGGVKVDLNQLKRYATSLNAELEQRQQKIREMAGEPELNILSTKQIGYVIFEKLALDPKVKAKTGTRYSYSTDEETLNSLAHKHPIINEILEYRAVKKLLSTYIEPFPNFVSPKTGKIHTTYNQTVTATGRISSTAPNLQNIPIRTSDGREIRRAFIPDDGCMLLSADYSQIELRLMADFSGDPTMVEAFNSGADIHRATAAKIYHEQPENVSDNQRRNAKTANFGIIYGISAFGLSQRLEIPRKEAKELIDGYFASYPKVKAYMDAVVAKAREEGFVTTIFGRRRYLNDIASRNAVARGVAERNAVNAPIQGSAADIMKIAMIEVHRRFRAEGVRSQVILQVHDELVVDLLRSEQEQVVRIVTEAMEGAAKLRVRLVADAGIGSNWLEAH